MGLLAGQETTLKEGTKIAYYEIWNKCIPLQHLFQYHTVDLIAGIGMPYFRIHSVRSGIELNGYICEDVKQTLNWEHNAKQWVIPDWVVFKTKSNAYAKKYGYKSIVKLTYDPHLPEIVFENGETTKEFANCIVVIKRNSRITFYDMEYGTISRTRTNNK